MLKEVENVSNISEAVEIIRPAGPISSPLINTSYTPSRTLKMALKLLEQIKIGTLHVTLPNGNTRVFSGAVAGKEAYLRLYNDRPIKRFMKQGKLGFCESYIEGDWSSPNMTELFLLFLENNEAFRDAMMGKPLMRLMAGLAHKLRPNSKKGSRKNIHAHYDIGNDFYKAWLDDSMTYSAAYFADGIEDLESAQIRKYGELAYRLDIQPGDHVLELGCGWGGFAEYAATYFGCKVTGITVSQAQYEYAKKRIEKAGLNDKVEILLMDYRDVTGQFDRVASIEMFEAVGEQYWPTFFEKLQEVLKPGGRIVMQVITINDDDFESYRRSGDYIQKYIFPGGMLPSKAKLSEHIKKAGLIEGDQLCFGKHYGHTLKLWNERFQKSWLGLKRDFGYHQRFKRTWEQYMAYCEAGFYAETIDVVHQTIDKPKN